MDALLIQNTIAYVKSCFSHAEPGHDWWHTYRVWMNAKQIGVGEKVNMVVVELAALLHDIADAKFHDGDETLAPELAAAFLENQGVAEDVLRHVVNIIKHMSFKNSFEPNSWTSLEMQVVQDADRLDAIGAIGIARAFSYGGFKQRAFYDPEIPPNVEMDKETYKKSTAPTINHFYEKLLLLTQKMNTSTAKAIAQKRHRFMELYLQQFFEEWEGLR